MLVVELIRKIRDKEEVSEKDIQDFIKAVTAKEVPDYQVTAWLMAVYFQGLTPALRGALTLAMRDSGKVIDWSGVAGRKVDKHSTGGVGDKISIPLAPLVAACGVKVPMVSGRGLGHTGGTLDKLESIPGFRVDIEPAVFKKQTAELGLCLAGQTKDIAPADKKLYALRDVTGTVESIDLISASIMSKKLSEGIDGLVLDVKVGSGAFMKTLDDARALATSLIQIGEHAGVSVRALLTSMEQPLGVMVGNALEIRESIDILKGGGPADSRELTVELGAEMLVLGQVAKNAEEGRAKIEKAMADGSGVEVMRQVIAAQSGDPRVLDNPDLLPTAKHVGEFVAPVSGVVTAIDTTGVGMAGVKLGGGRARAEDAIDPAVGFEIKAKLGQKVNKGEPLALVHYNTEAQLAAAKDTFLAAYTISDVPEFVPSKLILERLSSKK